MSTDTITTEAEAKTAERIEKISKLIAKSKAAGAIGNQVEADAYIDMALKLMAKYDIEDSQINDKIGEVKDELVVWNYQIEGQFAFDQTMLFFDVTNGVGARALRFRKRISNTKQTYIYTMRVWGFESQTKRIKFLFEVLKPQMLVGSAAAAAICTWEPKKTHRKTWMAGFGTAIEGRLARARREAVQEANEEQPGSGTSAELVLADKNARARDFFEEANTKIGRNGKKVNTFSTISRKLSGTGHSAGYRAGQTASFGDNHLGGSNRLALGR